MKNFLIKYWRIELLVFIIIVALVGTYASYTAYISYKLNQIIQTEEKRIIFEKEKQEVKKEKEKQKVEIAELKNKLTELENKPAPKPQVIYNTIEKTTEKIIEQPKETSMAEIVKEWSPLVIYISCKCYHIGLSATYNWSGSGFITLRSDGIPIAVTNRHVMYYQETPGNDLCNPDSIELYLSNGEKYTAFWDSVKFSKDKNVDVAIILLSGVSTSIKNLLANTYQKAYCPKEPEIGEKIVILGYPGVGSNTGVTATDGIISGYEGSYYVTSAKIEHGNSGGVAISVKDNCIVGIPSASVAGSIESLGRILSYKEFVK